jgi:DNA-binding HxlR family transcriptional regulator
MLESKYPDQVCSVARALEVVGERWTLLIVREALMGVRRFDDFRESLGLARSVLTARLNHLVDEGVFERRQYQSRPERYEYQLTAKGRQLGPVVVHLMHWGDSHYPSAGGAPRVALHRGCGGRVSATMNCARCRQRVAYGSLELKPGPGLRVVSETRAATSGRRAVFRPPDP